MAHTARQALGNHLLLQLIFSDLPALLIGPTAESSAEEDEESHDEGQPGEDQAPIADSLIVIVERVHFPFGAAA